MEGETNGWHRWGPYILPVVVTVAIAFLSAITYYNTQLDAIHVKIAEIVARQEIVFKRLEAIDSSIVRIDNMGTRALGVTEVEIKGLKEDISVIKMNSREVMDMLIEHEHNADRIREDIKKKLKIKEE